MRGKTLNRTISVPNLAALLAVLCMTMTTLLEARAVEAVDYRVQLDVISDGYESEYCWIHPRAGAIPGRESTIVLAMQKYWMPESDAFFPIHSQQSGDLGETWTPLIEHKDSLGRTQHADGTIEGICDLTPKWHAASGQLLATGHTVTYTPGNQLRLDKRRFPVWSVYQEKDRRWTKWRAVAMPDEPKFWSASAGSTQRVDLENGDILLPMHFRAEKDESFTTTVARCRFEEGDLRYVEHGTELHVNIDRGLFEASLARYNGRFFLTMRNDRAAYYSVSEDGLNFSRPRKWTSDDGTDLGSYNTQAHWVSNSDGLFLVYTRSGANNDNVFRHRAPLFMAQVDPEKMIVQRCTEKILVPNAGAQLGNFAVVDVSAGETWVTTSEVMTPGNPQKFGSNGRVYAARILWENSNGEWDQH